MQTKLFCQQLTAAHLVVAYLPQIGVYLSMLNWLFYPLKYHAYLHEKASLQKIVLVVQDLRQGFFLTDNLQVFSSSIYRFYKQYFVFYFNDIKACIFLRRKVICKLKTTKRMHVLQNNHRILLF